MSDRPSAPTRPTLAATGDRLMAAGLAFCLAGLMTLAFGPPTGWPAAARELVTSGDDAPGADETRPDDDSDPGRTAAPAPSAPGPAPLAPAPLAIDPDPMMPVVAAASMWTPSVAAREASTAPTRSAGDPPARPAPSLPITKILIPRIQLEADVAPAQLVEREGRMTWEVPAFQAGHVEGTAGAGGLGNAVLLGHVASRGAGNVFQGLDRARVGDRVRVFSAADELEYRVVEVRKVARMDVSILRPTRTASLSLVTCTGSWLPLLSDYTQRLVVRAELTDPAGAAGAPTGSAMLTTAFEERFVDNGRQWPSDPRSTAWLADGGYRLFAREPGRFVAVGAPIGRPLRDVVVTGAFRKVGGPPGGGYGLIVRDEGPGPRDGINQGGRYYVFEVGDRGELGIWRREDDHWDDLLPWSPSDAVRPGGAPNMLTVRAIGPRLTFLVNGVQVASLDDAALTAGGVGVFLGGDSNEGRLEWFLVQAL